VRLCIRLYLSPVIGGIWWSLLSDPGVLAGRFLGCGTRIVSMKICYAPLPIREDRSGGLGVRVVLPEKG
jgi:hypothetical protein